MLGENHSLIEEFPEFEERIKALVSSDSSFANEMKKYNSLDAEIRNLELNNAPIDDESMHNLKQNRATLKDRLFHTLSSY